MLRLVWGAEAVNDLQRIIGYIADRDLGAAKRLQSTIEHTAEQLPSHPYLYRPECVTGTREAVIHPNYISFTGYKPKRSKCSRSSTRGGNIRKHNYSALQH